MSRLVLKSPADLAIMHDANLVLRRLVDELRERIRPGVTTADLDALAERRILEAGGRPAFKGYPHRGGGPDFPGSVCTSVNDEVVHGIPSTRVVLSDGDIVSVDLGIVLPRITTGTWPRRSGSVRWASQRGDSSM